jgi:hypothetical protein
MSASLGRLRLPNSVFKEREFDNRRLRAVARRATALKQGFSLGRAQPAPTKIGKILHGLSSW